jgi:aspartyl-tRNA(Asn)/glutamyl-tRNA(Gln) amidotransferase subunit A
VTELSGLSLVEAAQLVRTRAVSPVEIALETLERVRTLGAGLNCMITLADDVLQQAQRAERELARDLYRGPLHGLPVAIKDNLLTKGIRTTGGSLALDDWRSLAPGRDATIVARLRRAGALILGKTNLYEFAYGFPHPHFGPVGHPHVPGHTTGGSSNGSAAAVAAHLCYAAIGTDTGGSIRIPAAFCGLVGIKPSLGRVGRGGIIPLSTTLDHVGPLTRHVADTAVVLDAISGYDRTDPASSRRAGPATSRELEHSLSGLRIGFVAPAASGREDPVIAHGVAAAATLLAEIGADITEIEVPWLVDARRLSGVLTAVEAAEFHQRLLRERPSGYSAPIRQKLKAGTVIPGADYLRAQRLRFALARKSAELFTRVDALVMPAILMAPLPIEEWVGVLRNNTRNPVEAGSYADIITRYTAPWNVTGEPAVVLPFAPGAQGFPAAVQVVAARSADAIALRVARALESMRPWTPPDPMPAEPDTVAQQTGHIAHRGQS